MYLDPGFGSMVIQLLIGGIAAMGTGFFLFRQKIKKALGLAADEEAAAEDSADRQQEDESKE